MCGIVGIAGRLRRDQLLTAVNAMNIAVAHRGPDDEGAWVGETSPSVCAGSALSIWQAATSRCGIVEPELIVYNGEVYNYKTIRAGLEKSGMSFQTTSDSGSGPKDARPEGSGRRSRLEWNVRRGRLE